MKTKQNIKDGRKEEAEKEEINNEK